MKCYLIPTKNFFPIYVYASLPIPNTKLKEIKKAFYENEDKSTYLFLCSLNKNEPNIITGQFARIISIENDSISFLVEGFSTIDRSEILSQLGELSFSNFLQLSSGIFEFEKKALKNLDKEEEIDKKINIIRTILNTVSKNSADKIKIFIDKKNILGAISVLYSYKLDSNFKDKLDLILQLDDILEILDQIILQLENFYAGIIVIDNLRKKLENEAKNRFLYLTLLKQKEEIEKNITKIEAEYEKKLSKEENIETKRNKNNEIEEFLESSLDNINDTYADDYSRYKEEIFSNNFIPEDVKKLLIKDVEALKRLNQSSPEYQQIITYLDLVKSLPWLKYSNSDIEISQDEIKNKLDQGIYGLKDVKERIKEIIAFLKLKKQDNINQTQTNIICLVGPPGTGKTSIAKLISECTNREFIQISLGGMHDESELRGHRRTYVGAMPGRIISELSKIKTSNPLILLDEIDKVNKISTTHGNPYYALLEILDPSQNMHFKDNYLNIGYDISKALFVATANQIDDIPLPLYDRMQIININSYTENEKIEIAKKFLIPNKEKLVFDENIIKFDDEAIKTIITQYTYESGVRKLSEKIEIILNKVYSEIITKIENFKKENENKDNLTIKEKVVNEILSNNIKITKEDIAKYLENKLSNEGQSLMKADAVGIVNALAWTMSGGSVLNIEAVKIKGKGENKFTGQLGDVMLESVNVAHSFVKSYLSQNNPKINFSNFDIHVHAPDGATPKDGPSAGIALASVIYSTLTNKKIRANVAMTGEISLTGNVLKIGGVREKLQGAIRAKIELVLLPNDNKDDYKKIDKEITDKINVKFVNNVQEVFNEVIC